MQINKLKGSTMLRLVFCYIFLLVKSVELDLLGLNTYAKHVGYVNRTTEPFGIFSSSVVNKTHVEQSRGTKDIGGLNLIGVRANGRMAAVKPSCRCSCVTPESVWLGGKLTGQTGFFPSCNCCSLAPARLPRLCVGVFPTFIPLKSMECFRIIRLCSMRVLL